MAGSFLKQIERARASSTQRVGPAEKPAEEMTSAELDEAMRLAKVEVVEANRAVAAAVAADNLDDRHQGPATLAAKLAELQRGKRKTWR